MDPCFVFATLASSKRVHMYKRITTSPNALPHVNWSHSATLSFSGPPENRRSVFFYLPTSTYVPHNSRLGVRRLVRIGDGFSHGVQVGR